MSEQKSEWAQNLGLFALVVSDLIGFTGIGVAVGYWSWSHWGAPWWVLLLCSVVGLILAIFRIARYAGKLNKMDKKTEL